MGATTPAVLSVRVSPAERLLLVAAAEQAQTNLSDFVRRSAVAAAEIGLLDRGVVAVPAEKWAQCEAWAKAPAKVVPALSKLASSVPVWWG